MVKGSNLDGLISGLHEEETRLQGELTELEEKAGAVRDSLRKVQSALAELTGKGARAKTKGSKPAGRGVSLVEAGTMIEAILKRDGPLSEPDLAKKLGEEADQKGKTKSGLHLVVKNVLNDKSRFASEDGKWKLKS